jgi:hypothetical protein
LRFNEYETSVLKEFSTWFPPSAWGNKRFSIEFLAGGFTVKILRRSLGSRSDRLSIQFADAFQKLYEDNVEKLHKQRSKSSDGEKGEPTRSSK